MNPLLVMRGIRKSFSGVVALNDVSLSVGKEEIHSIVGENGAGKSTLMKILSGVYKKDAGSIRMNDEEIEIANPSHAIELGIGTVYQNLDLIPHLSVAENIFMNRFMRKNLCMIDYKRMNESCTIELEKLDVHIPPETLAGRLSVADQQLVAIARALSRNVSVLIMDEPTSSLSPKEANILFANIRKLKGNGVSTIFITHHMDEIFDVADKVTVLRDGRMVGEWDISELDENELVHHMVGRKISEMFPKERVALGDEELRVEHVSVPGKVKDVSFSVKSGEILGIGGLVGAGRSELGKAVFGALRADRCDVWLEGKQVRIRSPKDAVRQGIVLIPEDRHLEGCVTEFSVKDNITLANLRSVKRGPFLSDRKERELSESVVRKLGVKTAGVDQPVKNLSGGNQQKVVLGKWFSIKPKVIILDEPTRGIDVGAKSEIHHMVGEFAKEGMAVIVISSELPELLGMSDRIIVLSKGIKTGEFTRSDFSPERIMLAATS